jgi:hypothetical protein
VVARYYRFLMGVVVTPLAACVPATEELAPRGAAGVVVEPSAATRGEPIVTSDGWTVRFEKFAFMAIQRADTGSSSYSQSSEPQVWGASRGEAYIPALPVSVYDVDLQLNGLYLASSRFPDDMILKPSDVKTSPDVEPAIVQRFLELPDNNRPNPYPNEYSVDFGPSVVFALRAEKAGRTYSMELALETRDVFDTTIRAGSRVEVHANALAFAGWEAHAERLLDESSTGELRFSDIAAADDNGDRDGHVTAAELREVKMVDAASCAQAELDGSTLDSNTYEPPCATLVDRLATRARRILVQKL